MNFSIYLYRRVFVMLWFVARVVTVVIRVRFFLLMSWVGYSVIVAFVGHLQLNPLAYLEIWLKNILFT